MKKILILAASCLSLAACKKDTPAPFTEDLQLEKKASKPDPKACLSIGLEVKQPSVTLKWSSPDHLSRQIRVAQYDSATRSVLSSTTVAVKKVGYGESALPYHPGGTVLVKAVAYNHMGTPCDSTGQFYR